ncbi:MAG: hypothetical protein M1453_11890 [Acidobacteria bacterium]|nr:hypothetical protein [Acidobacteriota bacterium]MCL5288679.1 hypothetical protein [Acidobacteriota bacterium]
MLTFYSGNFTSSWRKTSVTGKHVGRFLLLCCFSFFLADDLNSQQPKSKQQSKAAVIVLPRHDLYANTAQKILPLPISDGRLVVIAGAKVYMLGASGAVTWSAVLDNHVYGVAHRPSSNEIGVIGDDLAFFRLDLTTGKEIWHATVNGRASFADIKPFRNGYLIVVDLTGYRVWPGGFGPPKSDQLRYYGASDEDYWSTDFPVGAHLSVAGDKIYAVKFGKKDVTLQEIKIPSPMSN